jgi:succinate dehydrogenase / fumarate reductase membrane anchor subunit
MVKSVLSVSHQGLRDWIIQRVSAIFMAVYSLVLIFYLMYHDGFSYAEWHDVFSQEWMKIATLLFIAAMLYHAWIGIWTIFTDYVKPYVIRCILNFFVLLMLAACFVWGLLIVWSV